MVEPFNYPAAYLKPAMGLRDRSRYAKFSPIQVRLAKPARKFKDTKPVRPGMVKFFPIPTR